MTDLDENAIAIVGLAGRFPGAPDVSTFWRHLCDGVESVTFFSDEELAAAGADLPGGSRVVKARAVLEDADLFDAAFFGVNPREAEVLDPQHRIFLECAWEALENAGCDPARFDGAIGTFAGMSWNTYFARNLLTRPDLLARLNDHQIMLGNDKDYLPTRVSYKLNLRGPSVSIQTACSTSLVAVCAACQNLLSYDCDLALAGGVSVLFPQKRGYIFQEGGITSPDGHCRAFDEKAAGTVPGEGAGIVVLRRLAEALEEGDHIWAVIKGFALNNDGSRKAGYTAPSVDGQAAVIATAQSMAGFSPGSIGYVEAHGTGTPLGDPIELEGLTKAFRAGTTAKGFCALGSVKTNIGHLDAASGVAGLIKTVLALHHRKIPPTLHFTAANPKIDFANSPFFVNNQLLEWPAGNAPCRAGVSSFGIGGTNAHVVLEEAPSAGPASPSRPAQLVLLSARTEAALAKATANLTEFLRLHPESNLADVAGTLQQGRHEFAHRRAVVCHDANEWVTALEGGDEKRLFTRVVRQGNPPVVFLFPGQGAQQVNTGRALYENEPGFREQVDYCCEILKPHAGLDLRALLYPRLPEAVDAAAGQLVQTAFTQPALFVMEYAMARLWMSWGIQPEAMIGHSLGEYVAACLAGVFSLEDALMLVAKRGRMMQQMPAGAMLAVRLPERELAPLLNAHLALAAVNASTLSVVSGTKESVMELQGELNRRGVASKTIRTSHAFHSPMMEPILKSFAEEVRRIRRQPPAIPWISGVTGTWISAESATDPDYWAAQLRHTVRFADGLTELFKTPGRIYLEVGPGRTLCSLAKQHPGRSAETFLLSSLADAKNPASDLEASLHALGQLWSAGVTVNWQEFHRHEKRRRVPLPTYPFERQRYFIDPRPAASLPSANVGRDHADRSVDSPDAGGGRESANDRIAGLAADGSASTEKNQGGSDQRNGITTKVYALLSELSGFDVTAMGANETFIELGFDSLLLSQVSLAVERQFGVPVAFRKLLEDLATPDALASHVESLTSTGTTAHRNSARAGSSTDRLIGAGRRR